MTLSYILSKKSFDSPQEGAWFFILSLCIVPFPPKFSACQNIEDYFNNSIIFFEVLVWNYLGSKMKVIRPTSFIGWSGEALNVRLQFFVHVD